MNIKTFFIALLLVFAIYEIFAITIGVIKKKKELKKQLKEKENNEDVSN